MGDRFLYGAGAAGRLWPSEDAPLATVDTPFDLASVTKPVTALAMARLERAGALSRKEALADALPALAKTVSARVPLNLFAAHRAGLEGHGPLYEALVHGGSVDPEEALVTAANARRAECAGDPPDEGFAPVYSDLGYLLVGAALARRSGVEVDEVMTREVLGPLGLAIGSARAMRARDASFDARVAPTEIVPFRGGLVRGVVHDENAFAVGGDGACGHAGLFGDALSVARLGVALLEVLGGERSEWLTPNDLAPLLRPRPGGTLLAGFDGRSDDAPSSGARLGPRTFGHLGFTGTSLWIDPDAGFVGVLLTNRVHPTRTALAIRQARPAAYDAMYDAMVAARVAESG
ncbi:beta-lactamase family protein [Polyangium aurulentum]|nr:beta-lactamase family protein [Polyangium aurulentum]